MISTLNADHAPTKPAPQRHYPRWHIQRGVSRIAQWMTENTLCLLVDIGLGGFQTVIPQPLPAVDAAPLLLILDSPDQASRMMPINATQVWTTRVQSTGLWYAGFRIDNLEPTTAVHILRYIEAHKPDNSVVLADADYAARSAQMMPFPATRT